MSSPSSVHLNRILVGLFFLTAGTFGAYLGVRSALSVPQAKVAPVQDQLVHSSSAAAQPRDSEFPEFKETQIQAETGAIIKIGAAVPEQKSASAREHWEQLLKEAPLDLLRKHYFGQVAALQKDTVDQRFPRVASLENGAIENEILIHAFEAQQSQGKAHWVAQARVRMGGKDRAVSLVLSFYHAQRVSGPICWTLETFFTDLPDSPGMGTSSCSMAEGIRRKGDRYFLTQLLDQEPVDTYYSYLAVELPFRGSLIPLGSGTAFELLDAQTREWKPQGMISWTQIDEEEAERYKTEFRASRTRGP